MTTKQRTISPRIDDETRKKFAEAYGNANAGATVAVRHWMPIRTQTLCELDIIFAESEWEFADETFSRRQFDLECATNQDALLLRLAITNGKKEEPEDFTAFVSKLEALTFAQQYFFVEWACMPERLK